MIEICPKCNYAFLCFATYAAHASTCLDSTLNQMTIKMIRELWKKTTNAATEIGVEDSELLLDTIIVVFQDFIPDGARNLFLN